VVNGSLGKEKELQREKFKGKERIVIMIMPSKEKGLTKITSQDPSDQGKGK